MWAWWGSIITYGLLVISSTLSFAGKSGMDIIDQMHLPVYELDILADFNLLYGLNMITLISLPLFAAFILLLFARKQFSR